MGKLAQMEVDVITDQFYSHFCGINLSEASDGIHFVCSELRNEEVRGLGCRYSIYVLVKGKVCVVAYAPQYAGFFARLKDSGVNEILEALNAGFKVKKMQLMVFRQERVQEYGNARILKKEDYPLYEAFFRKTSPSADPTGWLQEYFEEKAEKEYFAGYFSEGTLVSVCDAPDMPYMEDVIQHTGIKTVKEERRKGYAKRTAALVAHHLLEKRVCPQWECQAENVASIVLAESIGYEKYGMAYILEE